MKNIRQSPYKLQQNCRNRANLGSTDCKLNRKFVTEQEQVIQEDQRDLLKFRIQCLEEELRKALQKQNKLKVQNSQLLSMAVTSCTNSSGASHFIKKVEQTLAKYIGFDQDQKATQKQQKKGLQNIGMSSKRSERSTSRSHSKSISNFSTTSSAFSYSKPAAADTSSIFFSKMTKKDIRERLSSVKRIEKQLVRL